MSKNPERQFIRLRKTIINQRIISNIWNLYMEYAGKSIYIRERSNGSKSNAYNTINLHVIKEKEKEFMEETLKTGKVIGIETIMMPDIEGEIRKETDNFFFFRDEEMAKETSHKRHSVIVFDKKYYSLDEYNTYFYYEPKKWKDVERGLIKV